jgi:hypothetical protein
MAEIIHLQDRRRPRPSIETNIVKLINGEAVECVNLDALSPSQLAAYFSDAAKQERLAE